jgi:hypothetical protein
MQLTFLFQPVADLEAAAAHYRSLDWVEVWREGEHTIAFQIPGVETQLMLDDEGGWGPAGPMYLVGDLDSWLAANADAEIALPVEPIPGGRVVGIQAPGHRYYVFEMAEAPADA